MLSLLRSVWKSVAACATVCGVITTINVRIHDTAQREIATAVRTSIREALGDITDRIAHLEGRVTDHEAAIAVLRYKTGVGTP